MSPDDDSEVLSNLQPDLFTVEELVSKIQSRCKIKNLRLMSKEGLVGLFRRVNLPLPQRFYRANRRGKMLTSRRVKSGLDTWKKEEGSSVKESPCVVPASNNRLKPPPNPTTHSHKIRLTSDKKVEISQRDGGSLSNLVIKDKRKLCEDERRDENGMKKFEIFQWDSSAGRNTGVKRASDDERPSRESSSSTNRKKRRNTIKWP